MVADFKILIAVKGVKFLILLILLPPILKLLLYPSKALLMTTSAMMPNKYRDKEQPCHTPLWTLQFLPELIWGFLYSCAKRETKRGR